MKNLGQALGNISLVVLALAFVGAGLGVYTMRRSFPQVNGTVQLPGLKAQVDVYRDHHGVPHIYADNTHDLFMAQGYVHAQDRFYQMDFWRHITSGRLSELYGKASVDRDLFLRTVGWARIAQEEYKLLDADTRAVLEAYARGVNAYLASRSAADLSLEYSILGLNGLGQYRPEPWTPVNTLAWAKSMAWDLKANMDDEIRRAVLLQMLGAEKTADYMPLYPSNHPVIVPDLLAVGLDLAALSQRLEAVDALFGPGLEGIGSNSWVIAGSRTATGRPLLANDPHLSIQMPSIWYEIGLHCRALTQACPYDVAGFSFGGAPGVVLGHNARIAWGMTNLGADVQDLFIEKINPARPEQYEVNGEWVDMTLVEETILVKGGEAVPLTVRYTRHGPIIGEVYGRAKDLSGPVNGVEVGPGYAIALRWTALEPVFPFRALLKVNRAQNWAEFRDALRDFAVPSQNFVYADVDGNIGYQAPGNIPIRKNGDGLSPVPGWTDDYEWTGYIPFDELPLAFNPPEGYIATANNAVVGNDYPYLLSQEWDVGYRAQRIVDMIEAQPQISREYAEQMQGDDLNLGAQEILPYLLALELEDPTLAHAAGQLRGWDFQMRIDSQPAATYASFLRALVAETFQDELRTLPDRYWPSGGSSNWLTLRHLLPDPNNNWWDNTTTPAVETRDDILRQAFAEGYDALETRLGANAEHWKWGALHGATFEHSTLGSQASPAPIRALFNRGPYPTGGGTSIVNATNWNASRADPFAVTSLPSMRMVVDLGDLANSRAIHTTGQSGHAFHPHYDDMIDPWRLIQYHLMLWDRDDVEAQAEAHLTLAP